MGDSVGYIDKIRSFLGRDKHSKQEATEKEDNLHQFNATAATFGGSKKTKNLEEGYVARKGKYVKLTSASFSRYTAKSLLNILSRNHPDVSQALWNFKIIGNSGFRVKVTKMDGETEHQTGRKVINDFIRSLDFYGSSGFEKSKSLSRVTDQLIDSALLRGAISMEMVMDADFKEVLFFTAVEPDTIEFELDSGRLIPRQGNIRLDTPTFFHEGLDETTVDPYGTSPFLSVIRVLAFHLEVMEDLKMVIHNQGYGKYDITILEEVLLKRMPIQIKNNPKEKEKWLKDQLDTIITMYSKLDPDAAFVHFDSVKVGQVEGAKAMLDPQKVMDVIDTQILGALKQYSTLMGRRSQGQTEQYAKLEIKIFMKSVQRIQSLIESVYSRALTQLLNIKGMQGYVQFKFNDTEIRTELEKVNFEQIQIQNEANKRDQGWTTQDEAAVAITGTPAVGEPDKEMLGKKASEAKGTMDERQPSDPQSTDNVENN